MLLSQNISTYPSILNCMTISEYRTNHVHRDHTIFNHTTISKYCIKPVCRNHAILLHGFTCMGSLEIVQVWVNFYVV